MRGLLRGLLVPALAAAFAVLYYAETRDLADAARRFPDVVVAAVLVCALASAAGVVVRHVKGVDDDAGEDIVVSDADAGACSEQRRIGFWGYWATAPIWVVLATEIGFYVSAWAMLTVLVTLLTPWTVRPSSRGWIVIAGRATAFATVFVVGLYVVLELAIGVALPRALLF